ncbi:MAG: hypothetical protein ABSB75_04310 [Candidatus Limnocylindrales bacterium]|jgi:hypothetical protein
MEAAVRMRSLPRQIAAISVVIALALASYGCGASIQRGKVLFSTDIPTANGSCTPDKIVTSVSAGTSVYATYVFKAKPGSETVSLEMTKNGESYIAKTAMDTSDTQGLDCFGDTTDMSTLDGWGVGTYKVTLTANGATVAEGELTVN